MDRRRKILTNHYEMTVHEAIKDVVEKNNCTVFPKVRVADALDIDRSGIENEAYSYALKAHFDFLIADKSSLTKFAVEFDGPSHDTPEAQRKDDLKNRICEKLGLPLLRITANYLEEENESMSLLAWLIDVWFIFEAFLEAQEAGNILPDESFDYMFSSFDYFRRYRAMLWAAHRDGKLKSPPVTNVHIYDSSSERFIAGHFLELKDGTFVFGESLCRRNQLYPVGGDELASELAMVDAVKKLIRLQYGNYSPLSREAAKARYVAYTNLFNKDSLKYGSFGCGSFPSET